MILLMWMERKILYSSDQYESQKDTKLPRIPENYSSEQKITIAEDSKIENYN